MTHESWRPVLGFEGLYEVSDQGRVRSLDHVDVMGRLHKGRVRSPNVLPTGYHTVDLYKDGRRSPRGVHTLVLEAFVSACPDGMEGCHFPDRDPSNNRVENLRWDTHANNLSDRRIHGTDPMLNKTHCVRSHALRKPNLVRSVALKGLRECLACKRAHGKRRRDGFGDIKVISDTYYTQIMEKEGAQ